MSRGPGVGLSLGVILVATLIAAAITWGASPLTRSDSAATTQGTEVIYRSQHLLAY